MEEQLEADQFAFRRAAPASEVVHVVWELVEHARKWNWQLVALDGDLAEASDFVKHRRILEALKTAGDRKILRAASIREIRSMVSVFQTDKFTRSSSMKRA